MLLSEIDSKKINNALHTRRSKPLSLRGNFSWTFIGDGTYNACQWAMLAVIAKLVAPAKVGEYSLALAITAPVIFFACLNLRQVQATDTHRTHSFGEYFGLRIIMLAFTVLVFAGIIGVIRPGKEAAVVIALVALAKLFDMVSDSMYGLMQQNERMDYISISRITQGILQLTIMAVVFYLTRSLIWATLTVAIGSGLVTAFYDIPMAARIANHVAHDNGAALPPPGHWLAVLKPSWQAPSLWTLGRLSLPLGFVSVLGMLNVNIPRYFVQDYSGASELGIFSAMWSMLHPIGMVTGSVIQSVMPRMARYYVESLHQFKRIVLILLSMAVFSGLLGVTLAHFFGRQVLSAFFRPEYASHPITFQWMMVAAGMIYVTAVLNGATNAARSFKLQPFVFSGAVSINTLVCYLLVPHYGVLGATWAYCCGSTVTMLGFALVTIAAVRSAERREAVRPPSVDSTVDTTPLQA